MKEKIDDFLRLFMLWAWGLLGGGIIFPLRKVFGRIKMVGHEKRKSISPQEGVIVIYSYPFSFLCKPIIFPSSLLSIIKKDYDGKFWFFPLIERDEERGWKSIRRSIQRIKKEGKIIVLTLNKGAEDDDNTSRVRRFQTGISILSEKTQTTTIPIFIEKEEKAIPNQSFINDRLFFLSIWRRTVAL